jgi:hypothetical protein
VKDVECSGSAGLWSKVCTAGDASGNWRTIRLQEANMREAGDGGCRGPWDARLQLALLEVRDECSFGDIADGVGDCLHFFCFYSLYCFCCFYQED